VRGRVAAVVLLFGRKRLPVQVLLKMFTYDPEYTESLWRHEADARELAELDADRRDMAEYPAPALQMKLNAVEEKCCENPANFTLVVSYDRDPETGYSAESFYRCESCGNRICQEDYASLIEWQDRPVAPAIRKEAA